MIRPGLSLPVALTLLLAISPEGRGTARFLALEVVFGDRVLVRVDTKPGDEFDVSFIHSAERCRWTQHYRVGAQLLIQQDSSTFACFGAGMPSTRRDGVVVRWESGGYTVASARQMREVSMMNSTSGDITLAYRDCRVAISSLLDDFVPFTIRVR